MIPLQRVLRFSDFEAPSASLGRWLRENFPALYEKYQNKKILHIDGKAVRAASRKSEGEKTIYHLNAMFKGKSVEIKIKRVEEKENEITCLTI